MPSTDQPSSSAVTDNPARATADSPDAAAADIALLSSPDLVANSLSEYIGAWSKRVRQGESGMLPVVGGLILIAIIFQSQSSKFLSAGNLANLLGQGAPYVLLGMAEVFVLLLGEIDLSIGYLAGVGAVVAVSVTATHHEPAWLGVIAGLAVTTAIGALQGFLITRLKLPSFVVTLAGYLGLEGVLLYLTNREGGPTSGGTISIPQGSILRDLVFGNLDPAAGWIVMVIAVALFGAFTILRDSRRAAAGLVAPPLAVSLLKIAVIAAAGVAIVIICNINRGLGRFPVRGVPWSLPIVLGMLFIWTFLLGRTRFGRYVYAVGGNAEAARRAGVNLNRIRLAAFALTGLTAGVAGIVYASYLGSISNDINGGQLVLYAVAAAVIGGTSLFGGRGKMLHAVLGGLVVATIYNGMGLINLNSADQDMVIALVLLAAVTVDAVARRGSARA
jgi:D-xylose transport system permease protein